MKPILPILIILHFSVLFSTAQSDSLFQISISEKDPHPWNHLDFRNEPDNFQFAIVSDRTGGHRKGVFADAVQKLNLLQPEFVMSVGDLIEGYLEDTTKLIAQWEEFDQLLTPLEMPFFYLPGNHDISNPVMRELWHKRYGPRYYHFVYRDVLFITMDTNDGEGVVIGQEQIDYVKQALNDHPDVRWTFLFLHHPIWVYAPFNGFDQIEKTLTSRKYTVFAGHTHRYLHTVRQDQNYYVLATTGGGSQLRGPKFSEFDHVTWVTLTDEGPRMANLQLDGILSHDVVDTTDYRDARAMIQASSFGHAVFFEKGEMNWNNAQPFTLQFMVTNRGSRPMEFNGKLFHHHQLTPSPHTFNQVLEPGKQALFTLNLTPNKPNLGTSPEPLLLDWTLQYDQPDFQPDFSLEGTYEFPYSSSKNMITSTELPIFLDNDQVELHASLPDATLVYSLDGSIPDEKSPIYQEPIPLSTTTILKARMRYGENYLGEIYEKTYEKVKPLAAPKVKRKRKPGMAYEYFEGNFVMLPDFETLTPIKTGVAQDFDIRHLADREDHYALRYTGFIDIPETGIYEFSTYTDDGSQLFIDGHLVVDNNGSHSARLRKGHIALEAGVFPIQLHYFEDFEGQVLRAFVNQVGEERVPILQWVTH